MAQRGIVGGKCRSLTTREGISGDGWAVALVDPVGESVLEAAILHIARGGFLESVERCAKIAANELVIAFKPYPTTEEFLLTIIMGTVVRTETHLYSF